MLYVSSARVRYNWKLLSLVLFNSRQKEIVLSPSRSSWIPHNKGGKRRKSFLQFCFSSQCLGNAFTSGCLFSWMENITSWTEKKKKSKMQAHVTVFLVYCGIGVGVRKNTTEKVPWLCVKQQWGCYWLEMRFYPNERYRQNSATFIPVKLWGHPVSTMFSHFFQYG